MSPASSTLSRILLCAAAALAPAFVCAQTVVATVATGASPQAVVADPVTNKAYVAANGAGTVAVIDGRTGGVITNVSVPSAPSTLAIDPVSHAVYVGTAVNGGTFSAINGTTNALTSVSLGGGSATAIAVNPATRFIYVLDQPHGQVHVLDASLNRFALPVDCPGSVAANPVTNRIFVTNDCDTTVTVIDGATNTVLSARINLAVHPVAVAVNPATDKLYVATDAGLAVVDSASTAPTTTLYTTGFDSPSTLAVDPARNKVYVANSGSDDVAVVDGSNPAHVDNVAVGVNPIAISLDVVRNQVYVSNSDDGTVTAIDGATLAATTLTVGSDPASLAVNPITSRVFVANRGESDATIIDGRAYAQAALSPAADTRAAAVDPILRRTYIATAGGLEVIDIATNALIATIPTGGDPDHIAIDPAADRVYTSDSSGGTVTMVNSVTNTAATIAVENGPGAIAVNFLTHKAYVAFPATGHVMVIHPEFLVMATVTVPGTPAALGVDPTTNKVYVVSSTPAPVSVIDGHTNAVGTIAGTARAGDDIAVDSVTGRIYVARRTDNLVSEIDGSTGVEIGVYGMMSPVSVAVDAVTNRIYAATSGGTLEVIRGGIVGTTTIALPITPRFVAVDEVNDRIFVSGTAGAVTVDGASGTVSRTVTAVATSSPQGRPAVDPVSGTAYIPVPGGTSGLVVREVTPPSLANHAPTVTLPAGHVTSLSDPALSVTTCCAYAPTDPAVRAVEYGGDDIYDEFAEAASPFGTTLALARGIHYVTVFATDAMAGTTIMGQGAISGGTSFLVGAPTVFPIIVIDPPSFIAQALPYGQMGVAYNGNLAVTGGDLGPVTFTTSDPLPPGLTLAPTGNISGTPTASGTFAFTVTAADPSGGGDVATWSISVTNGDPPDTFPDAFTFTPVRSAAFGSVQTSNAITVSGINVAVPITVTGGSYSIGCNGTFVTAPGTIGNGQTVCVRHTVSGAVTQTTLQIGGGSANFVSSTYPASAGLSIKIVGDGTVTGLGGPCMVDCGQVLSGGAQVTLTASPRNVAVFAGWSGCDSVNGADCTVTLTSDRTVTATFAPSPTPRLANISTRANVLTGDNVMIGGFIIGGATPKTVAVVATGPSLAHFGVSSPLLDPTLTLVRQSDGAVIATNDDWQSGSNSNLLNPAYTPTDSREAAILATLPPGAYTAIVSGKNGATGVAVVAVYEVDHPEVPLINISTRGTVFGGDNVLIGGVIVQGSGPRTVVISATGPSLRAFGIGGPLVDPVLTLVRSSDQQVIATNDDWQSAPNAAAIQASGFAPTDPHEAAIMVTLDPGAYTAIVSGKDGATGVSVVGVFALP